MKQFALLCVSVLLGLGVSAQELAHAGDINKNITPFHDAVDAKLGINGAGLHLQAPWKQFKQQHPGWGADFNRFTRLPHRAFGQPISFAPGGNDPVAKAKAFLQQELSGFNLPMQELVLTRTVNDGKYIHVDFKQVHNNMEVLWSRIGVRFTQDLRIVMLIVDAHRTIPNLSAGITPTVAMQAAEQAISTPITGTTISNNLVIFPYPGENELVYKAAYAVTVNTQDDKETPGQYLTYVDASNGEILYRQNQVKHFGFNVRADAYPTNLFAPLASLPLKNLKVNVNGVDYYTDLNGNVTVPSSVPVDPTITLSGKFIKIVTGVNGSVSATYSQTGVNSGDTVNFPQSSPDATERHMTCYYHANEVHDFMKTKLPLFTAMDNPLTARVDRTDGNCNAFYNGSSINFYTTANGCNAFSLISDVMYHEYGHGISNVFYNDQGGSFDNGAMGEGYSDVWAFSITHSPIIGPGYQIGQPASTIRRYDINPKVYPQDIIGEVHADGEIIAGAWWDTGVNWGNIDSLSTLFAKSLYGLATGPDGTEGQVYHDILIDALQYDDDNGNIADGTPHFNDIVPAFAAHGIYLLSNTTLSHHGPGSIAAATPATITAVAVSDFPAFLGDVKMIYRIKGSTVSDTILMTKSGTNYTCQFPAATNGEVYEYIFAVYDYSNALSLFSPINSAFSTGFTQRNIPYYLLVGYNQVFLEPFTNLTSASAGWTVGNAPNDNATAGKWIIDVPVASVTNGDTVQTGKDHTTGNGKCAVTGNAASAASAPGNADVDGGRTTLITPEFNLASYNKPVISYWRWYSNSQAATNPGKDLWRVWISYNNGTTWNMVERTYKPDVQWRRSVVVADLSQGTTAKLMFTATDSTNATITTGTWVEAAIDDIEILELGNGSVGVQEISTLQASIYPNPANQEVTIVTPEQGNLSYAVMNTIGEVLQTNSLGIQGNRVKVNTSGLAAGMYFIRLSVNGKQSVQRLMIAR